MTIVLSTTVIAGGGLTWWDYPGLELWKFLNVLVFVAVGVYLLRRPLSDAFRSRREAIRRELASAEGERDEALEKLQEVERRLERLEAEVEAIAGQARAEAEAERERINRATDTDLVKLREQARREIESAGKAARFELQTFAAEESLRLAEKFVRQEISPADDERLLALSVEELGRGRV